MKNINQLKTFLTVLVAGIFAVQMVSAQVNWTGFDVTNSANFNWSDAANWSGGTPSGSAVTFPDGDFPVTTNVLGAVNNIVDTSVTISSLTYNNVTPLIGSPIHDVTTMIAAGQTLTVNGSVTVNAATNSTVNMAGTNCAFIVNASSGTFGIGSSSTRQATITLADGTNIIAVGTVSVGTSGSSNGRNSVINLGNGTNAIYANTINLGSGKASGAIQFAGGSGSVAIADDTGTGRATITLGSGTASGSAACVGQLLLTGHPINVLAGTVKLGAESSSGSGNQQGTVQFDNGVFDVTTILLAAESGSGGSSTGTLTVGGSANTATLIVNSPSGPGTGSFVLSDSTVSHASTGTFNLNTNGAAFINTSITKAAAANNTGTINVTGGALIVTNGTIGTAAIPVDNLNITNAMLSLAIPSSGAAATVTNLNLGGTTNKLGINSINATILAYPAALQVIKYTSANGTNAFNIGTGTLPLGFTGFISNDVANSAVDLVVTGGPAPPRNILWSGRDANNGNVTTSVWDINNTKDWLSNGVPVSYNDNGGQGGDVVAFDDTAATGIVTLSGGTVSPTAITVSNNTLNYTINDNSSGYALAGNGSLTKQGSQTLVLDNSGGVSLSGGVTIGGGTLQIGSNDIGGGLGSGAVVDNGSLVFSRNNSSLAVSNAISGSGSVADNGTGTLTLSGVNSFGGAVTVTSGGVLQLGNNSALGSTNSGTTISSGAALDVNGHNIGQEQVIVSGTGPDSTKGAIYNSGTNIFPTIARLTFAGDTTIGGPVNSANFGRWDLRSATTSDANGASLSTGGNAYNLTKVGLNQIGIVGVTVDTNLANIDVQGGIFSVEAATTGVGNPASDLTVESAAALQFFQMTNHLHKNIILQNNSSVISQSGNNIVEGPMIFNGTVNFIVQANGSLTLSNTISGSGSLTDNGTNTLIIAGNDSYSGGTVVNGGTFIMNGVNNSAGNATNQLTANAGTTVGGNGTYTVPVDIEGVLWPGVSGKPSTLNVGNNQDYLDQFSTPFGALTFSANSGQATNIFSLGSSTTAGSGINDLVNVTGDLDANGAQILINPVGALANGTYTLINYSGSRQSAFSGSVNLLAGTSRYQFALDQGSGNNSAVKLTVSGGPALLKWNNNSGDGLWNVQSSQNWLNVTGGTNDVFYNQDSVLLDDSIATAANPTTSINLTTAVSPQVITNNSTTNYTISGIGKITGVTSIVKLGSSTLAIATANDFTGPVTIAGGTVLTYNSGSLGAPSATVFITNNATLDVGSPSAAVNTIEFTNKLVVVSGVGIGGNGAIVNSSTNSQYDALQNVTLAGDTTFGGSQTWAIRATGNTQTNTASLLTGGQPFNLTKVGLGRVFLVGTFVDPALADVNVESGVFSLQTDTTSLGNPANALRLWDGADLLFYDFSTPLNKVVTATNAIIESDAGSGLGSNVISGPVTITGACILTNSGTTTINLNNVVSGSGGWTKNGSSSAGVVNMTATNTYTGNTVINSGTIALLVNGSIATSPGITVQAGATLDVSGRANTTLTLNSGQTLSGNGTINGTLTNGVGATVSPGTNGVVGKLTVTGNATLSGTTFMKLDKGNLTNDVLAVNGMVTYGGTLSLTNLSGTLAANDQFKLFPAGTYSGSFTIVPATPGANLAWDTTLLNTSGVLKVTSTVVSPPVVTGININGTTLSIAATNGSAGGNWTLLQSSDVSLPLSQWQTNRTGTFDGSGNLTTNIVNVATNVQEFYILKQ